MADGDNKPDITFEDADSPIGGLFTWPQIRHNPPNKPENIRKLTNLKAGIRKELKHTNKTVTTKGVFGRLLQEARDPGTNFSIQAYSQSQYRSRRDAYEVAWGSHAAYRDAKRNTTHKDQCYAPNVINHSPTRTSSEDASTTPNYAHPDITARSNYYMKN